MEKNTKQVAVAAGVAAGLAALAAGGYFMLGPNGKKNRKEIKGWTLKMKGDVLERLEKLKDVTPEVYSGVIDEVSAKYGKIKNIQTAELAEIAQDLKKHWDAISRDIKVQERTRNKKSVEEGPKKVRGATSKKVTTPKKSSKKAAKKATTSV